jgi:hypothetical protein
MCLLCYVLFDYQWCHLLSLWSVVTCLVLIAPLLYCTHIIRFNLTLCSVTSVPPFYATCCFVLPTFGYYDLYHVFRLPVCIHVYKISLVTAAFLIVINPVCCYCKVFCVTVLCYRRSWRIFYVLSFSIDRGLLYKFSFEESPSRKMVKY